jgi:hypothetical protein
VRLTLKQPEAQSNKTKHSNFLILHLTLKSLILLAPFLFRVLLSTLKTGFPHKFKTKILAQKVSGFGAATTSPAAAGGNPAKYRLVYARFLTDFVSALA